MRISALLPFWNTSPELLSDGHSTGNATISVSQGKLAKILFSIIAIFLIGHIIEGAMGSDGSIRVLQLSFWTDLNREFNVPTLFSCGLLLTSSLLLALIACIAKTSDRRRFRHWVSLSVIFLLLMIDELLSFHDGFSDVMWPVLQAYEIRVRFFYYPWVIIGIALVSVFFLVFSRFLFSLPPRFRNAFILSGFVYISGTIGLEMINGAWLTLSEEGFIYYVLTGIEEVLEMSGISIFICTLLAYLQDLSRDVTVAIRS